ncbi:hypothetical protein [uncultured Porphyromonas sp.]|uniref:hypothetical protein n=1 Tax=uncultured Porphyromonas sp. TaxID=159274 RepID=UPI0025FADF68|nr:hypothetical protein [uncultured Porphyromonas sp.]
MKQSIIGLLTLALLAGLGLSSCSLNSRQEVNAGGETYNPSAEKITFSFAAPRGLPTTYAIHDQAEWAINGNKITLYEFLAGTKTYVKTHTVDLTGPGPEYQASLTAADFVGAGNTIHAGENRFFLFVANDEPLTGLTADVTTVDQVMSRLISRMQSANASCNVLLQGGSYLPMVGVAKIGTESTSIPMSGASTINVDLIRAVARIDIQTTMKATAAHPEYKEVIIKDAVLKNAYDRTAVGEHRATGLTTVGGVKTFATIPAGGVSPSQQYNGVMGKLSKAFYLYETPKALVSKDQAPVVDITVEYDGKEHHVEVPFYQNGAVVPVKRNYLYTIILGPKESPVPPVTGQGVSFAIAVNEWNGPVNVTESLNLLAPAQGATLPAGYDAKTHKLTVAAAGVSNVQIPFVSNFARSTSTIVANAKGNPDWVQLSYAGSLMTLTVKPNTTGAKRTAVVSVADASFPTAYQYEIKIEQD